MNPIINLAWLKAYWKHFEDKKFPFYAMILYTDVDVSLASYVRTHYKDLNEVSGNSCLVFAIEKPQYDDEKISSDSSHKSAFKPEIPWNTGHPLDKVESYNIAKQFGLEFSSLPCIILFKDVHGDEIIYYKIEDSTHTEITKSFRNIFSLTQKYANDEKGFTNLKNEIKHRKIKALILNTLSHIPIASIFTSLMEQFLNTPEKLGKE